MLGCVEASRHRFYSTVSGFGGRFFFIFREFSGLEKRPFYLGIDGQIVSAPLALLLNVPQAGGFLVKTVVKDSLGERLGLQGGDRAATMEGQQLVLGGDIILAAQGIEVVTLDDLIRATKAIRDEPPGREVRMRVLRAGKVVELATTSSGGPEGGSAPR